MAGREPLAAEGRPAERGWRAPSLRLTVREASEVVAAALIDATLHFIFAGLPLSSMPINGVTLSVQPAVVVPIFMGLTAGPLVGGLVGLAGRFLGDLLAGQGINGFGLLYSAVLGLVAGLGYRRLNGFRNLGQVALAFGCAVLACAAASLASVLLAQTLLWRSLALSDGLNSTLSQFLSGAIITLLLVSTPLFVWDRTLKRT